MYKPKYILKQITKEAFLLLVFSFVLKLCFPLVNIISGLSVVDSQDSSSHSRVRQKMMKFNLLSNFKESIQKALSCRT